MNDSSKDFVLHLRLRPATELDEILLRHLKDHQLSTAAKLVMEALRAYWLAIAVRQPLSPEKSQEVATVCVQMLVSQCHHISLTYEEVPAVESGFEE